MEEGTEEVNISLVAMNSLVTTLQSLKGQMARNEKAGDKVERALTDMAAQMSQVRDALRCDIWKNQFGKQNKGLWKRKLKLL